MPTSPDRRVFAPPFFFSGPTRTVVAHDEGRAVVGHLADREALLEKVDVVLRQHSGQHPVIVGAVPFAEAAPVRLFCPNRVSQYGRWSDEADLRPTLLRTKNGSEGKAEHAKDGLHFMASVRAAVDAIDRGALRKVVLARVKDFELENAPDVETLLRVLRSKNPHGFVFSVALADTQSGGAQRTLVGASPELLISRRGNLVVSTPLAGSVPRAAHPQEDRERAERLQRSPKDRHEHGLVVEQILENLRPFTKNLRWEREPTATATAAMWHLSTRIEGTLRDGDASSLRLALALHPTPAVCGTPSSSAADWIRRTETFDRGYFTGTLGHMDARGDGDWIVTIRCAELSASHVRVFAGAGIVASSEAEAELAETEAKMRTMLDALGVGASS